MLLLSGAARGWTKAELAAWLEGPYERLACPADTDRASWAPPSSSQVAPVRVTELLDAARADVLLVLRELTIADGLAAFASHAIDARLVARSHDVDGGIAFVPRSRPRMSLVDRMLSLVAADALARPHHYAAQLFVCSRCDMPMFDRDARAFGSCAVHRSGMTTRED